jgi:hypothetical protein
MAKRRSIHAEQFDLPIDDPRHLQLRDDAWIWSGEWMYYWSWLEKENYFDLPSSTVWEQFSSYLATAFPKSAWLAQARSQHELFATWAKARYRESDEGQRYPIRKATKEERAIVQLIDHPELTDEQIRVRINATEKTMKRWSSYNLARIEQKRLTPPPAKKQKSRN